MEFNVVLWTRTSANKQVWIDFTTLLAEYFTVHKNPMSRFDIAHLFNFWDSISYKPAGVLVAYLDKTPVGCVMIETMEPRPTRPHGHEISRLFVREGYRGRGIGDVLMREAVERLHKFQFSTAFLLVDEKNRAAVSMYEKMGFVPNLQAAEKGTKGVLYLEAPIKDIIESPRPAYHEPASVLTPRGARMARRLKRLFANLCR